MFGASFAAQALQLHRNLHERGCEQRKQRCIIRKTDDRKIAEEVERRDNQRRERTRCNFEPQRHGGIAEERKHARKRGTDTAP